MTSKILKEGEHYSLMLGKFGTYFISEPIGSELTNEQVLTILNSNSVEEFIAKQEAVFTEILKCEICKQKKQVIIKRKNTWYCESCLISALKTDSIKGYKTIMELRGKISKLETKTKEMADLDERRLKRIQTLKAELNPFKEMPHHKHPIDCICGGCRTDTHKSKCEICNTEQPILTKINNKFHCNSCKFELMILRFKNNMTCQKYVICKWCEYPIDSEECSQCLLNYTEGDKKRVQTLKSNEGYNAKIYLKNGAIKIELKGSAAIITIAENPFPELFDYIKNILDASNPANHDNSVYPVGRGFESEEEMLAVSGGEGEAWNDLCEQNEKLKEENKELKRKLGAILKNG